MLHRKAFMLCTLFAAGGLTLACSDSEAPAEDHDPATFVAYVNGVAIPDDTIRLTTGETDTVRIQFFNAAGDDLDDHETDHFSLLTFVPATGLASTTIAAHHFQTEVVVTAPATTAGTVTIGFGHDVDADEHRFPNAFAYLIQ